MLEKDIRFAKMFEVWIFATGEIVLVPEICPGVNVRGWGKCPFASNTCVTFSMFVIVRGCTVLFLIRIADVLGYLISRFLTLNKH